MKKDSHITTREYKSWVSMLRRCGIWKGHPDHDKYYANVEVHEGWIGEEGFKTFLADVGTAPSEQHTLDRLDNARGYVPGNVRWATWAEQARNRSNNKPITAFGRTQLLSEWARELGMPKNTLSRRLKDGWSAEDALSRPPHKGKRYK